MILEVKGKSPVLGADVYVAPSADIMGDVEIGARSSIWFRSVIRGDVMPIKIGEETNIQDGAVIHGTINKAAASIGNRVTIGHGAILHGCQIGDRVLVGMNAVILDNAKIPELCIVGAGSLVTENATFPSKSLILGSPAKVKRTLTEQELAFLDQSADNYLLYKSWYEGRDAT